MKTSPLLSPEEGPVTLIRPMVAADVAYVAKLHVAGFPNHFLSFLGHTFLCDLYTAILTDTTGISFIAVVEDHMSGFVAGTTQLSGFYSRLIRWRASRFALAALPAVMRRPSILPRLVRAFGIPRQVTYRQGRATIMSLAVHPDRQRNGIGTNLVRAFLREASTKGLDFVDLATDRLCNEGANRFYQGNGFVCQSSYVTPEGRAMNEYVFDLSLLSSKPD